MSTELPARTRRYPRVSPPKGMFAAWYGGGDQQVSRVATLSMGGLFLCGSRVKPVGTSLKLIFEVPEGLIFAADAVVRNVVPGEGMGVEFTKITSQGRDLLERLLERSLG